MSGRPAYSIIPERVKFWFLFKRKFHMDVEQLADMLIALESPIRFGIENKWVGTKYVSLPKSEKRVQYEALDKTVRHIIHLKKTKKWPPQGELVMATPEELAADVSQSS